MGAGIVAAVSALDFRCTNLLRCLVSDSTEGSTMGIPYRYWRVCDKCGEIVSIASDDPSEFVCAECGSLAAWEFTTQDKALTMQAQVRDPHTPNDPYSRKVSV